jgi:hypothetical protein
MPRSAPGRPGGFARLRPALIAHRRRFVPPAEAASPGVIKDAELRSDAYAQFVLSGAELLLDSVTLHGAFTRLGEDVSEFRFARDRDGRRRWLLTTDDRLVEVEPFADGVWARVARQAT